MVNLKPAMIDFDEFSSRNNLLNGSLGFIL